MKRLKKGEPSLLHKLRNREMCRPRPSANTLHTRRFYEAVVPNYTVYDVECPNCFIKKFTPDGEYLVCFSRSLHELQLYRFVSPEGKSLSKEEEKRFTNYFKLVYEVTLTNGNDMMAKEFCLFSTCGNYLILASSVPCSTTATIGTNAYIPGTHLEDLSFHLVSIADGKVHDKKVFKNDYINLPQHNGVYLYNDLFAVLSLQNQKIHVFQIKEGQFVEIRQIGPHCFEDDELLLNVQRETEVQYLNTLKTLKSGASSSSTATPFSPLHPTINSPTPVTSVGALIGLTQPEPARNRVLGGLQQRILGFLYNRARAAPDPTQAIRTFYFQFEQYTSLVMWRMQFLDDFHLLIKFGSNEAPTPKSAEANNQTAFFVVYNMVTTEVVAVYQNTSLELAILLEQYCSHFRGSIAQKNKYDTSCSNNIFVRDHLLKQKQALLNAKNGGNMHAARRVLSGLPVACQSCSESPLFDQSLFIYDEKVISAVERPKPCVEYPIKFYSRKTGQVKFKLNPGIPETTDRTKRFASYIAHPCFPFIISVQHTLFQPCVVNFHFRRNLS
jgi:de-etiolated-1